MYTKGYIYKITSPSGKIYVGQAVNIVRRKSRYNSLDCKEQVKIYRSIKKYGFKNHTFEVIEECVFDELNNRERYWQEYYCTIGKNGLNCFYVQTDLLPRIVSDDTKQSIKEGLIGKIKSGKDHYRYGTKLSDEQKAFLSKVNLGKKMPQSAIDKMSGPNNHMYGKQLPEWHKKRLSEIQKERFKDKSNHPFTGRNHKDESKQKMSNAKKGKKINEEWRNKIVDSIKKRYCEYKDKIVLDLNTGIYYYNCSDAARYNNLNHTTLSHMLVGSKRNKTNLIYI
jgi:group I intron endonuclease